MAVLKHVVKAGDTVWGLCERFGSSIAGNDIYEKMNTVKRLNNIKDIDWIYVDQILILSENGSTSTTTPTTSSNKPDVTGFGLRSDDTSGRSMIVNWTWSKDGTAGYTCRWQQYLNGKWVGSDTDISHPEDMYCQSTFSADKEATKVQFQVRPFYKENNENKYWDDVEWSDAKIYDFSDNPPLVPPVPTIEIKDLILTMKYDGIKADELGATCVKFNVIKDNVASVYTSPPIQILSNSIDDGPLYYYTAHQYTVKPGSQYKVRACTMNGKEKTSGWSDFSDNKGTKPSAPSMIEDKCRRVKRTDGSIAAHLEWTAVPNAEYYIVEYTTVREDFTNSPSNLATAETEDVRTSLEITGIESGHDYFFRVKAVNAVGNSDPSSPIVEIPIGKPPAAPTTWSSSNSAFVGDTMELNWIHNSSDGSTQTNAQLSMQINDGDWYSYEFANTTNENTGEQTDVQTFAYGQAISYKGSLHVKMDTTIPALKDAKIVWKVRTAGVTDEFSDTDWSVERTIYIYDKPTLVLSMVKDLADENGTIVENLDSFPFYIRGVVDLDSYELQRPIGYHLRVVSTEFYETIDDIGRTKAINPGDAIYSKYFDTSDVLIVEMSANNIDLESGIKYSVHCAADMSTGLSVNQSYEFSVNWVDVSYVVDATIGINKPEYSAVITPHCTGTDGELVENVVISIYRREYDGSYTEIAKNVPNNGTSITDPHPSLDYARYRLVAKDTVTGAISFYDMIGYPVKGTAVIIQWDEEWSNFNVSDELIAVGPDWSGSMVSLPYNIDVSDNRKREVEFAKYVGRENPVTYYGTHRDETSTWSVSIPKNDKETIYALRRLSLWTGDVYVREPSGMGYWANITVRFNQKHKNTVIPVTIDITRVEGGM
jgi:hypothetical protein